MKTILSIIFMSTLSLNVFAAHGGDQGRIDRSYVKKPAKSKPEIIKWEGYIESDGGHTTRHDHYLEFVRKSDGESFNIVDSHAIEKVHCDTSKKLLVKIEAEKTSRFLFWGGNLIVNKFEVLEQVASLTHKKYLPPKTTMHNFERGGHR